MIDDNSVKTEIQYDNIKKIEATFSFDLDLYDSELILNIFNDKNKEKYFLNTDPKIKNLLGLYLMSIRKYDDAISIFLQVLDLGWKPAMRNLANCYKRLNNYSDAEQYYRKSILEGDLLSYLYLGLMYMKNDANTKALEIYEEGINNGCGLCALNIGEYYENTIENYDKALEYYLKALELISEKSNCEKVYSNLGLIYCYNFKNMELGIKYLKKGMELNDSKSFHNYAYVLDINLGDLEFEQIIDYESIVIENYLKSIEINYDIDSIYNLALIYKAKSDYDNMKKFLNLGIELNDYDCMITIAKYYLKNDSEPNNMDFAIKYYTMASDIHGCEYSIGILANIYGSSIYNDIEKFIRLNSLASNLKIWRSALNLGLYYYKINNNEKANKYLYIALNLYWSRDIEKEEEFYEDPNCDNLQTDEYIKKFSKIFDLKIPDNIKNINPETNIIEYINLINNNFKIIIDNFIPVLIIIILSNINEPKILLQKIKKIYNNYEFNSFLLAMINILEKKIYYKTIKNRIKRARKNKNYKDCIVCYENKIHIKFQCGHQICICCYKKVYKCYYNCEIK